jgi:magnesium transporter
MKNPLLVPELREMLTAHRVDEIRDFCAFTPPEVTAEFLSAMNPEEGRTILEMLEPEMRSLVFAGMEDEGKLAVLGLLDENEAVEIVQGMPEESRDGFLERLPTDQQQRLREKFQRAEPEDAQPLLEAMDEALMPEPEKLEELSAEEIANEVNQHLETYKFTGGRVERAARPERGCWLRIINPSKDNLPLIAEHFKVPLDFLTAALDLDETARIEIDDQATLFILKIPYYDDSKADVLYFTIPVAIILVGGMILTVCTRETSILQDFADNKVRHVVGGHRFILQFILRATVRYLQYLKQLNNAANIIQKKLEMESRNKQLIKLFNIEKSLVYFTTSLKSNMLMLERMRRMALLELNEFNENLLEDIFTECKQAIEMSNIYSDILTGMMDAFASVISNNLNIVMRLLTTITIVLTIPVLVASFFGMNVPVPMSDNKYAFLMIIGVSLVLCSIAVFYFVRRRWLEP